MLKAYSYTDNENISEGVHDHRFFEEEKRIASEFFQKKPCLPVERDCPVCGSDKVLPFAEISGGHYLQCRECYSIYLPVNQEIVNQYRSSEELQELRKSAQYQRVAIAKRQKNWEDLCFWLQYRSLRYMNRDKLSLVDIGNRYDGLRDLIKHASFCGVYHESPDVEHLVEGHSDIVLYMDQLQYESDPVSKLKMINNSLLPGGLLVLSSRVGSGFDILTLKEHNDRIYPYEHNLLPSIEGIGILLENSGFRLLEISTPGSLDIKYVMDRKDCIPADNLFVDYLLRKGDMSAFSEFQRFLQKYGMSSHARAIAVKE